MLTSRLQLHQQEHKGDTKHMAVAAFQMDGSGLVATTALQAEQVWEAGPGRSEVLIEKESNDYFDNLYNFQ